MMKFQGSKLFPAAFVVHRRDIINNVTVADNEPIRNSKIGSSLSLNPTHSNFILLIFWKEYDQISDLSYDWPIIEEPFVESTLNPYLASLYFSPTSRFVVNFPFRFSGVYNSRETKP